MNKLKIEIYWAFYLAFTYILWMQIEKWLGFHDSKIQFQPLIDLLICIPFSFLYYRALFLKNKNNYSDQITFNQAFLSSIILTGIFAVFLPVAIFFVTKYISPDLYSNFINFAVKNNGIKLETASSLYNFKSFLFMNLSTLIPIGIVIGYIVSKVISNKK